MCVIPSGINRRHGTRPQSQCLPVHILSAKVTANHTDTGDDMRRVITRFDKDNIRANQPLLDLITDFANSKGVTPAQISLAWMLHKNDFIVPIPGSRKLERIQENLGAADVGLTDAEFAQIEAELAKIKIHGTAPTRTSPSSAKPPDPPPSDRSFACVLPPLSEIGRAVREPRHRFSSQRPAWGPVKCAQAPPATVTDQDSRPPAGTVR
jgi:hypothetical protein